SGSGTVSSTAKIAASSIVATSPTRGSLYLLQSERDSLADSDAHGGEAELSAIALQFLGGGKREARTGHSQRVAERDGAAVRIHASVVVGNAELPKDGEALRGEGLVELDHVEVADLEAEALHQLLGCGRRTDAHDSRWHA